MTQVKEDLVASFPNLEANVFKRRIYDVCVKYVMFNNKILKEKLSVDRYPADTYYTIDDQINVCKPSKTIVPAKKKRTPVKRNTTATDILEPNDISKNSDDEKDVIPEKKKAKSYPIIFNKSAKNYIDFIISRFLWEIFSIDSSDKWPETMDDIELYVLKHSKENFPKCNITELIIYSVKAFRPSNIITDSYGIDRELRIKFDEYLNKPNVSNFASIFITDFLKLLALFFSNNFWLEKAQTVNIKYFENALRYIELSIPVDCNTISDGLLSEINLYDSIMNTPKVDNKPKKKPTEPVDGEPENVDIEPAPKPAKKADIEPAPKPAKKADIEPVSKTAKKIDIEPSPKTSKKADVIPVPKPAKKADVIPVPKPAKKADIEPAPKPAKKADVIPVPKPAKKADIEPKKMPCIKNNKISKKQEPEEIEEPEEIDESDEPEDPYDDDDVDN
jgi:hypothetical protein